jgi:hypothetical protein
MSDQVSWGFYISNFAFLVGIAAAAVLLVIPAYIFHRDDIKSVVLIGEGLAVAAVISAMSFVIVDIGRPDRLLHMIPGIGALQLAAVDAGLGCAGAQRLPGTQPGDSLLRAFLPLPRPAAAVQGLFALRGAIHVLGHIDPYGDGIPVRRQFRAAVLAHRPARRRASSPRRSSPARL